jgi:hypothetical protein
MTTHQGYHRRAIARGSLVAVLSIGCGEMLGPETCLDGVSFEVGPGTEPTFDWRPACGVNGLTVRTIESQSATVWGLSSPGTSNALRPRVRYGQVPAGATGLEPVGPLARGSNYRLTLYAWIANPLTAGQLKALDSVDFVP